MTTRARLLRLEGSLSPRQAVVAWLVEARSYPSISAYAAAVLDAEAATMPLERILDRTERAVRAARRGGRAATIEAAVTAAFEEAITAFEVVLRLNVEAIELIARLQPLIDALGLCAEPGLDWTDLVTDVSTRIATEDDARAMLERRHLDGHAALFLDVGRSWRALARAVRRLRLPAETTNQALGRPDREPTDLVPTERMTSAQSRADAIADAAALRALELLGADQRADSLVHARLRSGARGASSSVQFRALERLSRRSEAGPPVAQRDHPIDHYNPRQLADGYQRMADEHEHQALEWEASLARPQPTPAS